MQVIRDRLRELSSLDRLRYHAIADSFDEAWHRSGDSPPDIATYLPVDELLRRLVLVELVKIDLDYRRKRNEATSVEDYLRRYDDLDSDDAAAIELICTEFEATRDSGATIDDYCARFARLAPRLRPILEKRGAYRPWSAPERYVDLKEIGQSKMSVVFVARDQELKRQVAIKVLTPSLADRPVARARFQKEVEILASLDHPNIVKVHNVDEHDGLPYFAMEYCPGRDLQARIRSEPLPPRQAAEWVAQIADAVHKFHSAGGVHRDLKPSNILLTANGTPKLTDFGLAKRSDEGGLTETGAFLGTLGFMAPEQAESSKLVTPGVDVYSLGAILYACLTQRAPTLGRTQQQILKNLLTADPIRPRHLDSSIPRELEIICLKCLEREPSKRYKSAGELAEDLQRFLRDEPIHASPPPMIEKVMKWARRRPAVATLLVLNSLFVITLACVSMWLVVTSHSLELAKDRAESRTGQIVAMSDELLNEIYDAVSVLDGAVEPRQALLVSVKYQLDELRQTNDTEPAVLRLLAQSYGRLAELQSDPAQPGLVALDAAEANFRVSIELLESLRRLVPNDFGPPSNLALVKNRYGKVLTRQRRFDEALANCQEALRLRAGLVQRFPDDFRFQLWLAASHDTIAGIHQELGNLEQAMLQYAEGLDLRRKVAAHLDSPPHVRREITVSQVAIAGIYQSQGDADKALSLLEDVLKYRREMAQRLPNTVPATRDVASVLDRISDVYAALRRPEDAVNASQEVVDLMQRRLRLDPEDNQGRLEFIESLGRLGAHQHRAGNLHDATNAFARAETEWNKLPKFLQESPPGRESRSEWLTRQALFHKEAGLASENAEDRHRELAQSLLLFQNAARELEQLDRQYALSPMYRGTLDKIRTEIIACEAAVSK